MLPYFRKSNRGGGQHKKISKELAKLSPQQRKQRRAFQKTESRKRQKTANKERIEDLNAMKLRVASLEAEAAVSQRRIIQLEAHLLKTGCKLTTLPNLLTGSPETS